MKQRKITGLEKIMFVQGLARWRKWPLVQARHCRKLVDGTCRRSSEPIVKGPDHA